MSERQEPLNSKAEKAVIYARFSSKNQKFQSIKIQLKACEEYAKFNGFEIVDKYCDPFKTGRNSNRKELQRLIADSGKGLFSVVLVHKIDRWFRNERESLNVIKVLKDKGIILHSVVEGSMANRASRLTIGIKSLLAEDESDTISERIRGGQKASSLEGKFMGGPVPLGFAVDHATQKYVIDENEAIVVRKIFDMYANGTSYTKIVKHLNSMGYRTKLGNTFGKNSLHDLLKNEKYIGRYIYGKRQDTIVDGKRNVVEKPESEQTIIESGAIPPIVDIETFSKAQERLEQNRKAPGHYKAKEFYLLSGIIRCGVCKSPMHVNTRPDGYSSYDCSKNNGKADCNNTGVRRNELDNYVVDELYKKVFSSTSAKELTKRLNEYDKKVSSGAAREIELAKRELQSIESQIDKMLDFVAMGGVSGKKGQAKIQNLEQKELYARKHLKKMKKQHISASITEDMVLDAIMQSKRLLKSRDKKYETERRNFIKYYVKKVIVYEDEIKVIFQNEPETPQEA